MGYESKLYIVTKYNISNIVYDGEFIYDMEDERYNKGKEMFYGEIVAMFDLCKVYSVSDKMRKYPATNIFLSIDNNDILKDAYGEPLKEIPLKDAIEILEDAAKEEPYRRWNPCLQMLKGFDPKEWDNLVVLHYGY